MGSAVYHIWVYLEATPLLGLTLTLAAYLGARHLHRIAGYSPLVNPVLIAAAALVTLLLATGTSYKTYFGGAQFVHFLLGPATVALAVPLYRNLGLVRRAAPAVICGLLAGSLTAILTTAGIAHLFGASPRLIATLAPRSVTTPVAMSLAQSLGGIPTLTAFAVILTGILGSVSAGFVLDLIRVRDPRARGLAAGVSAHGLGTARAFLEGEITGAFASLGMGLNAVTTAILLPLLAWLAHLR